ncbi:FAD binding domain-containing protein [Streptomyces sp. NPDC047072]|uniref:FAD binding domain-containing protein n=1 Tax=Streptomyces sp. NPDC047072 TaxID=3154809 RepID=UPI0033CF3676
MKPAAFEYHAPASAEETVALLAEWGDEAKVIAGGQSLVPMLALRLAAYGHLVDLRHVEGLRGIEHRDGRVRIGATTTQTTLQRSPEVGELIPLLVRATPLIGHFQIRNRGTIGGSLAHADAAAEYPAVALTLDAEVEALSVRGRRRIPAADELLTAVTFPVWRGPCGFAIEEFARRSRGLALAGAAVAVGLDGDGRIDRCAIGLFGLGPTPRRAPEAEAAAVGSRPDEQDADALGRLALAGLDSVPSDLHGSADYRRRVGAAMVARAWRRAVREAVDG